jgi:hypothetical protein
MKKLLIVILVAVAFIGVGIPKAKAMDPVTIAILAPIVIEYGTPIAISAGQYALKGLMNAGVGMIDIFKDMIGIFMLPIGFLEVTLGMPFGLFKHGCANIGEGFIAPFKLAFHTVLLVPRLFCLYTTN